MSFNIALLLLGRIFETLLIENITLFSSDMMFIPIVLQISRFFADRMSFRFLLVAAASMLLPWGVVAQSWTVSGKVVEEKTGERLAYVVVVNSRTEKSFTTSSNGVFIIQAKALDTLVLSCPSYSYHYKLVPPQYRPGKDTLQVVLVPQNFLLNEVPITAYRMTSNAPKAIKISPPARPTGKEIFTPISKAPTIANPIDFLYDQLGNRPRQLRELQALLEAESYREKLSKSTNRTALFELTGLNGERVEEFLLFCRLNKSQIKSATDYELLSSLLACFEEYDAGAPTEP